MSVKCGNCTHYHESVQDVKDCYRGEVKKVNNDKVTTAPGGLPAFATDPASQKQLEFARKLLSEKDTTSIQVGRVMETMMDVLDGKSVSKKEVSDLLTGLLGCPYKEDQRWGNVPEGKYATTGFFSPGVVDFWEVSKPTEGRWKGRVFVAQIVGSPGSWRRLRSPRVTTDAAMELIAADPAGAARLFGYKTRTCGRCGSPLSTIRSRAAGFGEHCASVGGWPYPSGDEARRILSEMGEPVEEKAEPKPGTKDTSRNISRREAFERYGAHND